MLHKFNQNIKLIATDMDGTLLNNAGELPRNFFDILDDLVSKDIIFAAASGRQYSKLIDRCVSNAS